jgi:hypothetical protein
MARRLNRQRKRGTYRTGAFVSEASDPLEEYLSGLSSLKAWFDPTSDDYFTFSTGAQISAWVSRLGSLGAVTMAQATSGNQPLRSVATASLNNKNTVQFDGSDDFLAGATPSDWTFMHNNTGACVLTIERADSTGVATQYPYDTCSNSAANIGMFISLGASMTVRVANGSGTFQNNFSTAVSAHFSRDVSKWRAWTYGGGSAGFHVTGSSLSQADTGGQTPSVAAPSNALTLGRSSAGVSTSFKGHLGDIVILSEVPSSTVRNEIVALLATKWAVAA